MVFVETSLFTKLLPAYLGDDDYRRLQNHLIERPDAGAIIQRSGGVRKVRWAAGGKGRACLINIHVMRCRQKWRVQGAR